MPPRSPHDGAVPPETARAPIPGGDVVGAPILRELPADSSLWAWQILRAVLAWAGDDPARRGELFARAEVRAWEEELLRAGFESELRYPLAVAAGELAAEHPAGARLSWACLCVADWALARRAVSTALVFAEAAALCSPEHPRYAWVTGRLLRTHGNLKRAGDWLEKAVWLAVQKEDWEAQSCGLLSLGNTYLDQGAYRDAARVQLVALRTSRLHKLRKYEGDALHNLMAAHYAMGDWAEAEEFARAAFDIYRTGHDRLAALAHDTAFLWLNRGYFGRALRVLRALLPRFTKFDDQLHILGSLLRAAGAEGETEYFEEIWPKGWGMAREAAETGRAGASALVEMGIGASSLGQWNRASAVLDLAQALAIRRGEQDVVFRVEAARSQVQARRTAETTVRAAVSARGSTVGDAFATRIVASLGSAAPA